MTDLLDEDELRRLLSEAADAAPAPGRAPEELLAALTHDPAADDDAAVVPMALRRRVTPRLVGAAAAAVLAVALIGATLADSGDDSVHQASTRLLDESAAGTTGGGDAFASTTVPQRDADLATGAPTDQSLDYGSGATATAGAGGSAAPATPAAAAPAPLVDSAKVVKTGSLDLQVRKGAFAVTVDAVSTKAKGLGGYVAEATTNGGDNPSGTITVRVPSGSFDDLMAALRKLGKVQSVTQKGTEVSAQYTDVQARLSALGATRDRLNVVLSKAETVPDILSVQDRITQVQTEIEQLQGQLRLLDDQTSLGTLAVSVAEPGAKLPVIVDPSDRTVRSAFEEARHRFGDAFESVIAWSGGAVAVLLMGLAGLVVVRLLWPRFRRFLL